MDSSDGLGKVLWSLVNENINIIVEDYPTQIEVFEFAKQLNLDIDEVIFNGGEEFLPIFVIKKECLDVFENLGFKKELSKIKDGFLFIKGDFKAVLVSVSGSYKGKKVNLGDFLEVEVLAKEKNEEIVKKLEKFALSLPGVSEIDNEFYAKKIVKMITSSD